MRSGFVAIDNFGHNILLPDRVSDTSKNTQRKEKKSKRRKRKICFLSLLMGLLCWYCSWLPVCFVMEEEEKRKEREKRKKKMFYEMSQRNIFQE